MTSRLRAGTLCPAAAYALPRAISFQPHVRGLCSRTWLRGRVWRREYETGSRGRPKISRPGTLINGSICRRRGGGGVAEIPESGRSGIYGEPPVCAQSGPTWNNGVRQSSAKNRYSHPRLLIAINLLLGDIFDILLPGICHLADVSYASVRYYNQINQPRETAITNDRRKYNAKLT